VNATLSTVEAAKYLSLSPSTLAKLRVSGNGPVYYKPVRRVVYRREDLDAWLESRRARNTSDASARLPNSLILKIRGHCSIEEAAQRLGIQKDTILSWLKQGLVNLDR
jgi:predicted site-specific integrase-resolvase